MRRLWQLSAKPLPTTLLFECPTVSAIVGRVLGLEAPRAETTKISRRVELSASGLEDERVHVQVTPTRARTPNLTNPSPNPDPNHSPSHSPNPSPSPSPNPNRNPNPNPAPDQGISCRMPAGVVGVAGLDMLSRACGDAIQQTPARRWQLPPLQAAAAA